MQSTSTIATAGLVTALVGTLAVPLITAYFTSKREHAARTEERRYTTYLEVISYAQQIKARLDDITDAPLYRPKREFPNLPDTLMIRAKLLLVAPTAVTRAFDQLTRAWDALSWELNESGPVASYTLDAAFFASEDDEHVVKVLNALNQIQRAVRPGEPGQLLS